MQSKRLWLLILLFLFTHLYANHAEDQTRCERTNGVYVLDKKTLSWGCYTLAYSIGDRAETSENRKKCEYSDKLYGWNGSQYDCFFPKQFISQPTASTIPPQTYTNATLERRALCEQNGNAFIWNGEENTWACRPMAYRINDKRINPTNQSSCESYGNQYLWDGKYYHCIGIKPIIPPTIEIKPNETLVRREQCEKNGDLFRWSDSSNTWECVSMHELKTPNETLIRRETCEQKGDIFEWNDTKNQWECIAKQTAQERKFLEQRKQACENLKKALIWNKNANDWECLPTSTSVSAIPYNEAQEKRAICEQRGFLYIWNGVNNEWQCFKHTDTLIDTDINPSRKTQCDTLGFYYLELENKKWSCVDDVPKPEKQNLELTTIKSKCDKDNGTLTWQEHRWVCSTKSTKEEIEKAQTPSLKSPTPIIQEKPKFEIKSHIPENIYGMAFTPDQKYLMTSTSKDIRVYDIQSQKEIYTLKTDGRRSFFHKNWIILFDNKRPLEIIDIQTKKTIYSLPYERVSSLVITEDEKKIFIFNYHTPLICWDLVQNKLLYTVNVRKIYWSSGLNIIPDNTPFYYENTDGQTAAFNIKTSQNITPSPTPPEPISAWKRGVKHPANVPPELNTSRNNIYYSPDQAFAVELAQKDFHVWNLKSGTKIYSHPILINRYYEAPALTNTHVAFHHRTSLDTSALYLFELAHPEKLIRLNYNPITISSFAESKKQAMLFQMTPTLSFDMQNAIVMQSPQSLYAYKETIHQTRYFSDGKRVALGTRGNQVILYDHQQQKELARFWGGTTSHPTSSIQIELSPDESKIVATANLERNIMVWDVNKSKLDYTIPNPSGNSNPFQLSTDGKYIISLNRLPNGSNTDGYGWRPEEGTINRWNLKTGILERSLPRLVTTFAIVPNSNFIILGENDGSISLWDIRNGLERFKLLGHEQSIQSLEVLPNNQQLLSRDRQNNAILWDNIQNEPKGTKMFHAIPYRTTLSHNGNYMLIPQEEYKKEGKIRLLNLKTSQYEYEFTYPTSYAMLRKFSDDDRYFFLSTPDNATKVFETATGKELATLQAYDNGEWIILTPQGYFNASANARMFLNDSSGNPIDDTTYQNYFKPDKVKNILNGSPQ